jgi:hypothetical protein
LEKKYFVFSETKYYREYLELKHLKGQNNLVFSMIFSMMLLTLTYMIVARYDVLPVLGFGSGYFMILLFNMASLAYANEHYYYLKFNKYITSISLFTMMIAMIIFFKSPSFIPLLFVAFAICSIYKDTKVLLVITLYFLFSVLMLLLNYKNIFDFENAFVIKDLAIGFFVLLFLLILLLSTFIIIKEKTFFYNNIAYAKEKEYRNLDLLLDFKIKTKRNDLHQRDYYETVEKLLTEFSEKIDIPNIFTEKLSIIKKLDEGIDYKEILKDYPKYNREDLKRLEKLAINKPSNLRKTMLKIRHSQVDTVKTREIFSATHFQSFNKQSDSIETKILCFVVYYVALKKGLVGMKSISNQELYDIFVNSDFYHFVDPRIMKIYKENADVFNTIVDDAIKEVVDND